MRKVSLDAGCAYAKVVAFDNNRNLIQTCVPSIIVRGKSTTRLDGSKAPSYLCEGQQWSIVESSTKAQDTRLDTYPYSDMNTVLIHHALREAGITNDEVQISTSIPLADYYLKNEASKKAKRNSIQTAVTLMDGTQLPRLDHQVTIPEGLAGWIDLNFDFQGNPVPDMPTGDVGLVDIGGRTTDIVVVKPGLEIVDESIRTLPHGYLDVFEKLNELINIKYPESGQFAINTLDIAMRNKRIEVATGRDVSIDSEVDQCIKIFTSELMDDVNRVLGNGKQLSGTCYFGGGVEHIRGHIQSLPKVMIPDDPQFSNARGNLKAFYL